MEKNTRPNVAKILKTIMVIGLLFQFSYAGSFLTLGNYLAIFQHTKTPDASNPDVTMFDFPGGCRDIHQDLQILPHLLTPIFFGVANAQDDASYTYESERIKFESDENIIGQGFTSVRTNLVDAGNDSLSRHLHGSGSYLSETATNYYSVNASRLPAESDDEFADLEDLLEISFQDLQFSALKISNLSAAYAAISLPILPNHLLSFSSKWSDVTNAISRQAEESFRESYRYAAKINRSNDLVVDPNNIDAKFASDFHGAADIRYSSPGSCYQDRYTGDFKLSQDLSSDRFLSSSTGTGFVDIDKKVIDEGLQRTYEHGSGDFALEEQIGPEKNYIAKDINLKYQPSEFAIDSKNSLNQSVKWSEGFSSKTEDNILISERFTDIEQMDKFTEAKELTKVQTAVNYTGKGVFRLAEKNFTSIEEYTGNFSISRKVAIVKLPRFDAPHVSVVKQVHLDPIDCKIADYNITVTNDGNWELGPVYVKDTFPTGTSFLQSSAQPIQLTTRYANWSIYTLSPGESISIRLLLKIEKKVNKLTNRVRATAYYTDKSNAQLKKTSNYNSTILVDSSICKPQDLALTLKATLDKDRPNVVSCIATVENNADYNMTANITAFIPEQAGFLESSQKPKFMDEKNASWSFKLLAGKKRTITYKIQLEQAGLIECLAMANATSVDGQKHLTGKARTSILIAESTTYYTNRTIGDWLPEYLADPLLSADGSIPCACIGSQNETITVYREPIRLVPAYPPASRIELPCC